jgi:phytoene synthase
MKALMPLAADYGIEQRHLLAVIEGCQMDLEQTRYLDFAGLSALLPPGGRHRGRGGGPHLWPDRRTDHGLCAQAGPGFPADQHHPRRGRRRLRGRIYLPVSELQQFDVKAHEILKRSIQTASPHSCAFRPSARTAITTRPCPAARRRPPPAEAGLMMASIYRTLLREIEHDNFQVLHQRVSLTPLRKLWLAWRVQALGKL